MSKQTENLILIGAFLLLVIVYYKRVKGDKVATVADQYNALGNTGLLNEPDFSQLGL